MTAGAVLKSPLLHFFALGALIFVAYGLLNDRSPAADLDVIVLQSAEAAQIADQFAATWNRPPTVTELEGLMNAWALEEVQYREAVALGLDQGDSVIRLRLSQKMQFISEAGAATLAADEAVLQAHLEAHADRFAEPAKLAFEQVLLPEDPSAAESLKLALEEGADPASLSRGSLLPIRLPLSSETAVDRLFGRGFAAAIAELAGSGWSGPVQSGYGHHLVHVTDRSASRLPPLSEIRATVEEDWRATRAREMREDFGKMLLKRYEVTLPPASEVLAR
ncbi:peptidylprolyl isomerase (plasmid) [Salipiger sp. H15]|uniref:Parvulin-like PPIase n=1 Tax=Alloyangia sp. H15 TaxID=3029062 RepID=A0AAU8AUF3_9RHOB